MNDRSHNAQYFATPEDLAACAAEIIETPETVQGFGAMAVFDIDTAQLVMASENLGEVLHRLASAPGSPVSLASSPLTSSDGLRAEQVLGVCGLAWADLVGCIDPLTRTGTARLHCQEGEHHWIALCHQPADGGGRSLLIAELIPDRATAGGQNDAGDGENFLDTITSLCLRIQRNQESTALLNDAAALMQKVLGYQRVMIYEFDHDWNGTVVAEATLAGVEKKYFDLRFPATDIPPQARALYEKNHLRIVVDVDTPPVRLVHLAPASGGSHPLDQSHALLRASSIMHIRYLQNMGVRSTLAISLMVNERLWGMLVCHHDSPRIPPHHLRRDVSNAARIISLALESRLAFLIADKQRQHHEQANQNLGELDALLETATHFNEVEERFLAFVKVGLRCDGVSVLLNQQHIAGQVLHADAVRDLVRRHEGTAKQLLSSESVTKEWNWSPEAWQLDGLGGVLSAWSGLPLNLQVVVRRQSQTREVKWGGRPELFSRIERPDGSVAIGARNSFATWVERVEGTSTPWSSAEQQHLADLVLRLSRFFLSRYLIDAKSELDLVGAFVPHIQDLVIVLDHRPHARAAGSVVYVNPAVLMATGYRDQELMGNSLSMLVELDSRQETMKLVHAQQKMGHPFELRLLLRRSNASTLWTSARFTPIRAPDTTLQFWICIQRDISEKVAEEASMQQANLKLEQEVDKRTKRLTLALRDVEKISYSMAHDLRGPLRAINGFSSILKEELADIGKPMVLDSLDRIASSSASMSQMINDLIELMYVVQGELEYTAIDMHAMVAEVWALLKPANRAVEFSVSDLPPAMGDARWLKQLVLNLMENALKYSATKEKSVIQVGYSESEQAYWISDNGVGMDMSGDTAKSKLFGLFQKMHSGRQFEGAGIGLAIVARIVERHNGKIWVHAKPGEGCTFFWTLVAVDGVSL